MDSVPDHRLLEGLRDIHLPEPVSWWPPAPGWWLLFVACALLIHALFSYWRRRTALRRAAMQQWRLIKERHASQSEYDRLAIDLSLLLRRTALARFPRSRFAGLYGERWLAFLDETGATRAFSQGEGRVLAEAPYRSSGDQDAEGLLRLAHAWIRSNT